MRLAGFSGAGRSAAKFLIGGALLPLYENFAPDRDLFLKIDAKSNGAAR